MTKFSPSTRSVSASVLALALTGVACAQPATPSAEAKKFHRFAGHWIGEGTVDAPGMGVMPWTAVTEAEAILGGFFVEERTEISVGAPMPMQFRAIYGWDQENERSVTYGVGNNGDPAALVEVHWVDDDTLVMNGAHMKQGEPTLGRTVWNFAEDGKAYTFKVEQAVGAGEFKTFVEGSWTRADEASDLAPRENVFFGVAAPSEMRKLRNMRGSFTISDSD